ncbi:NAD-dependent epimerase/dehydratase family protein [Enterococcus faecium]
MLNYLITGGAGFIGSTLANYLGKENNVVVIDDLSMGKKRIWMNRSTSRLLKGMSLTKI